MNKSGYTLNNRYTISRYLFLCILFFFPSGLFSQDREKISINEEWEFIKSDVSQPLSVDWQSREVEKINLPHSWNDKDVLDETPGYYRNAGWYKKLIPLREDWTKQHLFLEFEGANQVVEIFINGTKLGIHSGGYTGFRFDITKYLNTSDTSFELLVRVDNSFDEDIPPLTADFTFYGGIYRKVWLVYAPETHFSLDHFGGPGVYWQTPTVTQDKAEISVFGFLSNYSLNTTKFRVEHILLDESGRLIHRESFKQILESGNDLSMNRISFYIKKPALWSPDSPAVYSLVSRLYDLKSGTLIDEEINPIGFRWFEFSADHGFFLNGQSQKIKGISRHQDYPGKGNALDKEQHLEDILSVKEMGGNFLRIAHYPQDQEVISGCDNLGILSSVEIPIVNRITESEKFTENCLLMMEEMIWQNYNHPSLIMWTYMNEVLLRPPFLDEPERLSIYYSNVTKLAEKLEESARKLDPYRYTMIPNHGSLSRYTDAKLTEIPMLVGWNLYHGWYSTGFGGFGKFLDEHHELLPDKPLIVTEYGAGQDPRLVTNNPQRFDFTADYSMLYHQSYAEDIEERDFVSGSIIWILDDFGSEDRIDAVPHINSKGIRSVDRKPKESYWFYKSIWSETPFVKIWMPFPGIFIPSDIEISSQDSQNIQTVKIYTNAKQIEVVLNGKNYGLFDAEKGLVRAGLPLKQGLNKMEASITGSEKSESLDFEFLTAKNFLNKESGEVNLKLSCGDHRYFWDNENSELWLPDQVYKSGSWGYTAGEPYSAKTRHGLKPSSDQQILGTSLDPLFQTQRINPGEYIFDIPDGKYEVRLLFAELNSTDDSEKLAYNLGDDTLIDSIQEREFSVEMNDTVIIESLNLIETYGAFQSLEKTFEIDVSGDTGLKIQFQKNMGDPIISGIVVKSSVEK